MLHCKVCGSPITVNYLCENCLQKLDEMEMMFGITPLEKYNGKFKGLVHIFEVKTKKENN